MVAGSQVAHVFAYRLVYPDAQVRLRDLLATGHGYMVGFPGWAPLVLGVLGGAELLGLGWSASRVVRRRADAPVPPWAFALLPLVAFTLQEFLERWLVGASLPWWFVLQPTYRVGLLLQLPFALIVYLVARLLLGAAERIGRAISPARPRVVVLRARVVRGAVESDVVRALKLWASCLGRGPPVALGARAGLI